MEYLEGKIAGSTDIKKYDDGFYTQFRVKSRKGIECFKIKGIHENLLRGRKIRVCFEKSKYVYETATRYSLSDKGYHLYSRSADD